MDKKLPAAKTISAVCFRSDNRSQLNFNMFIRRLAALAGVLSLAAADCTHNNCLRGVLHRETPDLIIEHKLTTVGHTSCYWVRVSYAQRRA